MSAGHGAARFFAHLHRAVERSVRLALMAQAFTVTLKAVLLIAALNGWTLLAVATMLVGTALTGDARLTAAYGVLAVAVAVGAGLWFLADDAHRRLEGHVWRQRDRLPDDSHPR